MPEPNRLSQRSPDRVIGYNNRFWSNWILGRGLLKSGIEPLAPCRLRPLTVDRVEFNDRRIDRILDGGGLEGRPWPRPPNRL